MPPRNDLSSTTSLENEVQLVTPPTSVPLLDIQRQTEPLRAEMEAAVSRVFASGHFVLGETVQELESAIAEYCQAAYAIGCASGSDALLLALLTADVGPEDEVIVPSYTFFATASAVSRLGAKIVFADIDPLTFNLDPADVARRVTSRTKAIIPVHLFGQCADMDMLHDVAHGNDLLIIEDAAQAIGAEYRGRRTGSLGDLACFSFYPTKNLGGAGDGGMLTTNDERLADRIALLRVHGMRPRYYHQVVGINSRLDSLQAAVLNVKMPHLERWTQMRIDNADRYSAMFQAENIHTNIDLPIARTSGRHVWNQYVIRISGGHRDALRNHLKNSNVGTEIYYPVPLHRQACFANLGYEPGSLPETEKAASETLALPIFPEITESEQQYVVQQIATYVRQLNSC
jgi:dTDP-4-amino-4,6-dideoxygalactose transaminase